MKSRESKNQGMESNENNDEKNISKSEFITVNPVETPINNSNSPPPVVEEQNISNKINNKLKLFKFLIIISIILAIILLLVLLIIKISKPKKITSIGIYIGALNSGYYIIKDRNISLSNYSLYNSDIILDEFSLKGLEFGIKAKEHPKSDLEKEKRLYFYNFKKYLIQNKSIENITINSDFPKNKIVNLDKVIKEYFNLIIYEIKKNENIKNKDIKWIIIFPDSFDIINKNKLIELLDMKNIDIISETNAAYIGLLNEEKIKGNFSNNNNIMIINSDVYNTDINIYKINDNKYNLNKLSNKSFYFGANTINEKIIEIIIFVFGKTDINEAIKKNYDLWKITLDDIENKIKTINDNINDEYLEIRTDFNKNYKKYLIGFIKEYYNEKYKGYNIKHTKGKILIPYNLIKNIIYEYITNILNKIEIEIQKINEKIDLFIIMGEFSKSNLFKNRITQKFNDSKLFILNEYEKIIMKGSAIYGLNQIEIINN